MQWGEEWIWIKAEKGCNIDGSSATISYSPSQVHLDLSQLLYIAGAGLSRHIQGAEGYP